jgi:uncharacterized protein YifE (UPF0438 family)
MGELTRAYERETHINWNDEEDFVTVFTCHRRIMTKLERLGAKVIREIKEGKRVIAKEYTIPKNQVNIGINGKRKKKQKVEKAA